MRNVDIFFVLEGVPTLSELGMHQDLALLDRVLFEVGCYLDIAVDEESLGLEVSEAFALVAVLAVFWFFFLVSFFKWRGPVVLGYALSINAIDGSVEKLVKVVKC